MLGFSCDGVRAFVVRFGLVLLAGCGGAVESESVPDGGAPPLECAQYPEPLFRVARAGLSPAGCYPSCGAMTADQCCAWRLTDTGCVNVTEPVTADGQCWTSCTPAGMPPICLQASDAGLYQVSCSLESAAVVR